MRNRLYTRINRTSPALTGVLIVFEVSASAFITTVYRGIVLPVREHLRSRA
jgi:hypothetical protein